MVKKLLTGNAAAAWGARLADVDYVPAFPITPQTEIIETLAEWFAAGQMQDQMQKNLNAMDPESLMKLWMPGAANGMQAFADLQKNIWEQMTGRLDAPAPKAAKRKA